MAPTAHLNGVLVVKVLVDNGAAVNVIPTHMLKKINQENAKLLQTRIAIFEFIREK